MKEAISSKKLWFSVFAVLVTFAFAVLAAERYTNLAQMFSRFVDLVEFCVMTYVAGNVTNKYVLSRTGGVAGALSKARALVAPPRPEASPDPDPLEKSIPSK